MGRREAPKRAAVPQNGKPIQTTIAPASQMAAPVAEPEPQHEEPPIPPPPPPTLKERLATAIAKHSEQRESLLAQAGVEESRMNMLKGLEQYADDPAMADVLRAILPVDGPPALPPSPARPDMPQAITSTVQVTRQLVWAATQTFEDNRRFTINDVMALMVNGQYIEGRERLRVRGAIASCMMGLHERGLVLKSEQGIGRQQSEWKKVVPGAQQSTEGVQANV